MEGREGAIDPDRLLERLPLRSAQRYVLASRQVHQVHLSARPLPRPLVLPRHRKPDEQVAPATVLVQVGGSRRPDAHPQLQQADPLLQTFHRMLLQPLHVNAPVLVGADPKLLLLPNPARQQILDLFVVDLEHGNLHLQADQHSSLLLCAEQVLQHAVHHPPVLAPSSCDGVRLAAPRGPVGEDAHVVPVHHRLQQRARVVEELFLCALGPVCRIKMKFFASSLVEDGELPEASQMHAAPVLLLDLSQRTDSA
mmetsp:Transcript_34947/g.109243  ORF Transcript_34947/g.109243 Transcript_34947/m.109243 type:complete len:253 (-) Transcript_34947:823-1581(-)